MPLPAKLLARGVRDMVRVSDARMSGTAYGTVVLHVVPEGAAAARSHWSGTGTRSCSTCLAGGWTSTCPRPSWPAGPGGRMLAALPAPRRGWGRLYIDHVMQADRGADLDFLAGASGHEVARESH